MIYLDNSATTKIDPRVVDEMIIFLQQEYGNPSSKYYKLADQAKTAVDNARRNIANLLNCHDDQVIFTAGATESNNFIIKGVADRYQNKGKHIITSKIEHKSVMETCNYLEDKGFRISYLDVNQEGRVEEDTLKKAITEETILISIIWGNNEIGTINHIERLSNIAREQDILFHTDATQVLGKIDIDLKNLAVDFLSCSAHKIHGPKGIGAAIIGLDELGFLHEITPLLHGGEQEYNLRAGTLSVHNIAGFGKAAEIANNEMNIYIPGIKELEDYLKNELKNKIPNIKFNGCQKNKIPGVLNTSIPGINNEFFIKDHKEQIAISSGSACSITKPSHVLKALGLSPAEISSTLRISLSKYNTKADIDTFVSMFE